MRRRKALGALLMLAVMAGDTAAQAQIFGGGKPKLPRERVLLSYSATVLRDHLTVPPIAAGLGGMGAALPEPDSFVANSANYRGTLAALQAYVGLMAKVGPRPDIVPRLTLRIADRPEAYSQGEEMIVTTALLKLVIDQMRTDKSAFDELVFTLAHEYSHALYDHSHRFAERSRERGVAGIFRKALRVTNSVNRIARRMGASSPAGRSTLSMLQGFYQLSPYIENEIYRFGYAPYKREAESLADFTAVDLMDKMGRGDARAASSILSIYEKYDNSVTGQMQAGLKHLNEEVAKSFEQLRSAAPALMLQQGPDGVLSMAQGGLRRAVTRTVTGIIQRRLSTSAVHLYYSAEWRVEGVQLYFDRFYPPVATIASEVTAQTWGARNQTWAAKNKVPAPDIFAASFDSENSVNEAALTARRQLLTGDIAGARKTLDAARPKAAKSTLFHIVDAQTYQMKGEPVKAVEAYKRAVALPEAPLMAFIDLSCAQDLLNRPVEALATLDRAATRFGAETVMPAKIQHFVLMENLDAARKIASACAAYPVVREECEAAMPEEETESNGLLSIL